MFYQDEFDVLQQKHDSFELRILSVRTALVYRYLSWQPDDWLKGRFFFS